jgi:hypothetical protein
MIALAAAALVIAADGSAAPEVAGGVTEVHADVDDPAWISFDRDTGVLFTGVETGGPVRIWRIGAGGTPVEGYGAVPINDPDAVLHDPGGVMTGVPGSVLVGGRDGGDAELFAILPDSAQTVQSVFPTAGDWTNLADMEFDGAGRLLFGDEDGVNGRVFVATDPVGPPVQLFAVGGRLAGLEVDPADRIYTSTFDGTVRLHDADGSVVADPFLDGLGGQILPIAFSRGGAWGVALYTVNQHTGELIRADATGDTVVVGRGFDGFLLDLEFGPDDALYVSDYQRDRIWRIALATTAAPALALAVPGRPRLHPVHPQPCRLPATIRFTVPGRSHVRLRLHDAVGRWIATLVDGVVEPGEHRHVWNGRRADGRQVAAGVYLYALEIGERRLARKLTLIR